MTPLPVTQMYISAPVGRWNYLVTCQGKTLSPIDAGDQAQTIAFDFAVSDLPEGTLLDGPIDFAICDMKGIDSDAASRILVAPAIGNASVVRGGSDIAAGAVVFRIGTGVANAFYKASVKCRTQAGDVVESFAYVPCKVPGA